MTGEVKLLPVELTLEMIAAGAGAYKRKHGDTCYPVAMDCEAEAAAVAIYGAMVRADTRPTLVTGQLQEDGGDSNECPECQGRGERWVQPDGLPRAPYPAQCDYCHGTGTMATRAASETPTPGLTDDVVKELVEALEAFISTAVITPETHRVSSDEWVLSKCRAALARTGVTLNG